MGFMGLGQRSKASSKLNTLSDTTRQDLTLDIEDYSGRNLDADVLDTIVESSYSGIRSENLSQASTDDILDDDHWDSDSFEVIEIEKEY